MMMSWWENREKSVWIGVVLLYKKEIKGIKWKILTRQKI